MRIAMLAGLVALAVPVIAEAKTVVIEFDGLESEDKVYEEQGFQFSFDGLNGTYGTSSSRDSRSVLALQDGGTGSTPSAVITASDGSLFTLKAATLYGVNRLGLPYSYASATGSAGGKVTDEISFFPQEEPNFENKTFDLRTFDTLEFGFGSDPSEEADFSGCANISPCYSIFYDSVTLEVAAVPLPASAPMLLAGLGALWWKRRKGEA